MLKFDFNLCVDAQLKANGLRFDANETAAFSRELEYVHNEVIAAKYPDMKWRSVVPLKTGAPLGMTAHRWFEVDGFGEAKWLDNMATEDFGTADVQGAENTGKIRSMGAKWIVTVEELRASALMRVNVDAEKAKLSRRAIESNFDKAVFGTYNTTNGGFKGIAHNDMSTEYSTSLANWFTESAPGGDPLEIMADIRGALEAAVVDTKGAFKSFDMFLPPELGVLLDRPMLIQSLIGSDTLTQATGMTIGQYALATIPYLRSITKDCFRLTGAGASSYHRVLLYPRDPEVFDVFVPLDFEQFAPQLSGMAFTTHCHAKYGGVRMKHIKAVRRFDLATS
jgi:hypothetical protein